MRQRGVQRRCGVGMPSVCNQSHAANPTAVRWWQCETQGAAHSNPHTHLLRLAHLGQLLEKRGVHVHVACAARGFTVARACERGWMRVRGVQDDGWRIGYGGQPVHITGPRLRRVCGSFSERATTRLCTHRLARCKKDRRRLARSRNPQHLIPSPLFTHPQCQSCAPATPPASSPQSWRPPPPVAPPASQT